MKWKLTCMAAVGAISFAQAAELFVGSGGGEYANLAAALTAASAGDTITIRAGYSTPGAAVTKPNLTIRGENYHSTNANNPSDLYQLNPSRTDLNESVVTSPITLQTQSGGNPDGTQILGLFFNISSGSGSAVNFNATGGRAVQDVVVSNNRFRATTTGINAWVGAGGSVHSGSYGWADGILIENNRMGDLFLNNASALFPTGKDWTIKGNYINHDADGLRSGQPGYDPTNTTFENGRRGFNINGVAINPTENIVVVGNVFHDLGGVAGNSWALQPNGVVNNLVMADNGFNGNGRDIITYPTAGANQLIAGNVSSNILGGVSIDYQICAVSNMVVRQNSIEVDVTDDRAFRGIRIIPTAGTTGHGMLIENNQISLTGSAGASTSARAAIALAWNGAGLDRFDLFGPLTIQNNVIQDTGLAGGDSVGIFYTSAGGRAGGMNLNATNNLFSGLDYGAYVSADLTATSSGALPVGDNALVQNNNILNNITGVHGGTGGAGIGIGGSFFSGNTTDTSGNVYGTPGGSVNSVAGYDANYVTFRGDHNLSNTVDAADAAILVANMGLSGPGATYFRGDSTLNQKIDLDDAEIFARFAGVSINQATALTSTATTAELPVITYDASNGRVQIDLGSRTDIWGFAMHDGATDLSSVVAGTNPGSLGAGWFFANGSLILADNLFGTTQNWVADGSRDWVVLSPGLTLADFGGVTYYFGLGEGGEGTGTGSQFFSTQAGAIVFGQIPEPTSLALLGLAGLALLRRRR